MEISVGMPLRGKFMCITKCYLQLNMKTKMIVITLGLKLKLCSILLTTLDWECVPVMYDAFSLYK